VLGISKLQGYANFISHRYYLQEDLTKALYDGITKIAETDSVFVHLSRIVHGCEQKRSKLSKDGSFTSEYYGGEFNKSELRAEVLRG